MLRSGATLEAISTILRHQSPDTTLIYAKVDVDSLSLLATTLAGAYVMIRTYVDSYVAQQRAMGLQVQDTEQFAH